MNLTKEQLYEFKNSLRTLISEVANMDSVVEMALELVELKEKSAKEQEMLFKHFSTEKEKLHNSIATQAVSHVDIERIRQRWEDGATHHDDVVDLLRIVDQMREKVKRADELIKLKDEALKEICLTALGSSKHCVSKIILKIAEPALFASPQLKGESK